MFIAVPKSVAKIRKNIIPPKIRFDAKNIRAFLKSAFIVPAGNAIQTEKNKKTALKSVEYKKAICGKNITVE